MSRIIKRYDNRKLYDTETRRYVSLEEIALLVRRGVDVQVKENGTDLDLTAQTLTQIIFEEGKKGRNPFSVEMLHEVIRWGNHFLDDRMKLMRESLDQLVPRTLGRFLSNNSGSEIEALSRRIETLEESVNRLQVHRRNDSGEGRSGEKPEESQKSK